MCLPRFLCYSKKIADIDFSKGSKNIYTKEILVFWLWPVKSCHSMSLKMRKLATSNIYYIILCLNKSNSITFLLYFLYVKYHFTFDSGICKISTIVPNNIGY